MRELFSKTAYGKTPKESLPDLAPYTTFDYFSRKAAGVHALRHSFASRIYWPTADIRRIQSLLGHRSLQTTMIDPHILEIEGGHLAIGPAPHLTGCGSSASRTTLARKVLSPSVRSRGVSGYAPLTACGRFC